MVRVGEKPGSGHFFFQRPPPPSYIQLIRPGSIVPKLCTKQSEKSHSKSVGLSGTVFGSSLISTFFMVMVENIESLGLWNYCLKTLKCEVVSKLSEKKMKCYERKTTPLNPQQDLQKGFLLICSLPPCSGGETREGLCLTFIYQGQLQGVIRWQLILS